MRRKLIVGLLVTLVGVAVSSPGIAQQVGAGDRGQARMRALMKRADQASRWWNRSEVAEKVGLVAEQKSRLDELADATREVRRAAAASYAANYARFLLALSEGEIDAAELSARRETMEKDWVELFATSVDHLTAVRQVLSPEQWSTLREVQPGAMQLGQMRMRGSGIRSGDTSQSKGTGN